MDDSASLYMKNQNPKINKKGGLPTPVQAYIALDKSPGAVTTIICVYGFGRVPLKHLPILQLLPTTTTTSGTIVVPVKEVRLLRSRPLTCTAVTLPDDTLFIGNEFLNPGFYKRNRVGTTSERWRFVAQRRMELM